MQDSIFTKLNSVNVNEHTEKKNGLTYLSWAWAWAEIMKVDPQATYSIFRDEQGRPYIEDPDYGIMCWTSVTINGTTRDMWLPVMDPSNNAMRRTAYSFFKEKYGKKVEVFVAAATMFDINKTIMRCLVKNLAIFGLGLYIYAGEDLPEEEAAAKKAEPRELPYFPKKGEKIPDKKRITFAMLQAGNCAELIKWLKGKGCTDVAIKTMHDKYDWDPEVEDLVIRAAKNA